MSEPASSQVPETKPLIQQRAEALPDAETAEPGEAGEQTAARDATNWAKSVSRLEVNEVPEGARGINVAGKRLASPIQGFGKMWQKTYQIHLPRAQVSATEVIAAWKANFTDFWPDGNNFYAPLTGINPGEVALIEGTLPGKLKLSTGVMVLYSDDESFTLMTPQGHVFAGWITFSATEKDDQTIAQAQVLMRASDPIFELGLVLGGHRQEDQIWDSTLRNVAAHFGITEGLEVETVLVCVDKKRQWRRWTNVWQSAAIRSTLYMVNAPFRALGGMFRRGRAR